MGICVDLERERRFLSQFATWLLHCSLFLISTFCCSLLSYRLVLHFFIFELSRLLGHSIYQRTAIVVFAAGRDAARIAVLVAEFGEEFGGLCESHRCLLEGHLVRVKKGAMAH